MSAPADVLAAFAARFQPDAAGDLQAVYQLHLTGDGGGLWHLTIADRQCQLTPGQADQPSVTITMSVDDFTQLIAGQLDGVSAYLAGRIQIAGDISLVTRIQSLFGF